MLSTKLLEAAGNSTQPTYIEDVFSTYLYTGNGSTQTITNGIDLSGKGGLVWTKSRTNAQGHRLSDTARGIYNTIFTNTTDAQVYDTTYLTNFGATGFTLGTTNNSSGQNYASWTFRKQPKFFDVVTYTGDGEFLRIIDHNLQGTLGALFIKATSTTGDWFAWCRTETGGSYLKLNSTAAQITTGTVGTESYFIVGTNAAGQNTNASGVTYVAYLFAHNAGGFGLTGTDNVISCGSYAGSSGDVTVNLGYEPQWVMIKPTTTASGWVMMDSMRGMPVGGQDQRLYADASYAEGAGITGPISPTATGFTVSPTDIGWNNSGQTYIYIAIRRGPMKVPTDGTKVFKPLLRTGTSAAATLTGVGFSPDFIIKQDRTSAYGGVFMDRLRGTNYIGLQPYGTFADYGDGTTGCSSFDMDGESIRADANVNFSGATQVWHHFKRAPGFFDEVCYSGTNAVRTVSHNLRAVPELIILKDRTGGNWWNVYSKSIPNSQVLYLNSSAAASTEPTTWNSTTPTSSVFTLGSGGSANGAGATYVAYLFASCPGVSKVGSYTGNGTTQTINCGFAGGARFVMIKRTDSTGDWYVWDTARGIVSGNDPYLLLNSTAAEVTTTDYIDPVSSGFEISSTAPAAINASGGSYIYLAIA